MHFDLSNSKITSPEAVMYQTTKDQFILLGQMRKRHDVTEILRRSNTCSPTIEYLPKRTVPATHLTLSFGEESFWLSTACTGTADQTHNNIERK